MSTLSIATDGYLSGDYKTLSISTNGYLDIYIDITPEKKTNKGGVGSRVINKKTFAEETRDKLKELNSKKYKRLQIEDNEILNILKMFLQCQY